MAGYLLSDIRELAHQLCLSPPRLHAQQLECVENLVGLIDPVKGYPYDFVCYRVTGYRRRRSSADRPALPGRELLHDLALLSEDLTRKHPQPSQGNERMLTAEQTAEQLGVSSKTIRRWRFRGLIGRHVLLADGRVCVAFRQQTIDRFVTNNSELVSRGRAFCQMDDAERRRVVELAREQVALGHDRLYQVARRVAQRTGRAVETVRYTLRRYDHAHPSTALFDECGRARRTAANEQEELICRWFDRGDRLRDLALQFGRSKSEILRIVLAARARALKGKPVDYIYNAEFDAPHADAIILDDSADDTWATPDEPAQRVPDQLPPYLQSLYRFPLLTEAGERRLFRRYNYLKFKAADLQKRLDPARARRRHLQAAQDLLDQALAVRNEIVQANLRLVVSITKRHVGVWPNFFEVLAEGNVSLIKAVERFDYGRGYRFSTYASWAIVRNYARTLPQEAYYHCRVRTDAERALQVAEGREATDTAVAAESVREVLDRMIGLLTDREQTIVRSHFGLHDDDAPQTHEQIGRRLGVSKERVRQLERKALEKLRSLLGPSGREMLSA
jgi:RNA polymerase primary sigma factor